MTGRENCSAFLGQHSPPSAQLTNLPYPTLSTHAHPCAPIDRLNNRLMELRAELKQIVADVEKLEGSSISQSQPDPTYKIDNHVLILPLRTPTATYRRHSGAIDDHRGHGDDPHRRVLCPLRRRLSERLLRAQDSCAPGEGRGAARRGEDHYRQTGDMPTYLPVYLPTYVLHSVSGALLLLVGRVEERAVRAIRRQHQPRELGGCKGEEREQMYRAMYMHNIF